MPAQVVALTVVVVVVVAALVVVVEPEMSLVGVEAEVAGLEAQVGLEVAVDRVVVFLIGIPGLMGEVFMTAAE